MAIASKFILSTRRVSAFTRNGHAWIKRFKKVTDDAWHIAAANAIIDGEDRSRSKRTTDFSFLQNELRSTSTRIVLAVFDLLYLNGRDLRELPGRKAVKKLVAGTDIQFSERFEVDGDEIFAHACKVGLEGAVLKVRDSVHPTGARSRDWVNVDHGFDKASIADLREQMTPLIRKTQPYGQTNHAQGGAQRASRDRIPRQIR
jgi:bifunctional non-homologous end joining protein LigD